MQIGDPENDRRFHTGTGAYLVAVLILAAVGTTVVDWIWPEKHTHSFTIGILFLALAALWSMWSRSRR